MRKGKNALHGCSNELYIISYNPNADNYNGDFEIKIIANCNSKLKQFFENIMFIEVDICK